MPDAKPKAGDDKPDADKGREAPAPKDETLPVEPPPMREAGDLAAGEEANEEQAKEAEEAAERGEHMPVNVAPQHEEAAAGEEQVQEEPEDDDEEEAAAPKARG